MHLDLWNSLRLHNPYEYIPISYVSYGFDYEIYTHTSPSGLNMHIEIIQMMANQSKALGTIIKTQS